MDKFIWLTSKEYRKKYNITSATLWNRVNVTHSIKTKKINGHMYYLDDNINDTERINIIYCRVSDIQFENDLIEQETYVRKYCILNNIEINDVISIVSEIDDYEKNVIIDIFERIKKYEIDTIYISDIDRIGVVNFELLSRIFLTYGTRIVSIDMNSEKYHSKDNKKFFEKLIRYIKKKMTLKDFSDII